MRLLEVFPLEIEGKALAWVAQNGFRYVSTCVYLNVYVHKRSVSMHMHLQAPNKYPRGEKKGVDIEGALLHRI